VAERDSGSRTPAEEQLRSLYENAESTAAKAFEQAVSTPSFGMLLGRSAENVAALSRMGSDVADLVLRNLRLAGRADVTRLAQQLHRTEDKLERVLQEIEQLRDELAAAQAGAAAGRAAANGRTGRSASGRGSARSGSSGSARSGSSGSARSGSSGSARSGSSQSRPRAT